MAHLVCPGPLGHNSVMPSVRELELTRLRAMTASEKVAVMHSLWRQAWSLTTAGVRARHPEWPSERIAAEARAIFGRKAE